MREQFSTLIQATSGATAAVFRALASPAGPALVRGLAPQLRKAGALGLLLSDSLTPTQVAAGYKSNVVPAEARASFDCRLLPDTEIEDFIRSVEKRASRRGAEVANVIHKGRGPVSHETPLFRVLESASRGLASHAVPTVTLSPGITDVRYFRAKGASGYGWCPLILTPELLATIHGHDERIGIEDFNAAVSATTDVVLSAAG
jgi:carboxypeptidase PM20D1